MDTSILVERDTSYDKKRINIYSSRKVKYTFR